MDGKTQAAMNEGLNDLAEQKLNSAIKNFKEVIRLSPRFYGGHYYLGVCSKMVRKFDDAEKELQLSLQLNDTLAVARIELGELYEAMRLYDKAETIYIQAANQKSGRTSAYLHLGNMELRNSHEDKALKRYQTCLVYDPRSVEARLHLGLMALNAKNKKESLTQFSDALAIDSISEKNLFWRGLVHLDNLEYDKCLSDWDRLTRNYPTNPLYVYLRGYAYATTAKYDLAFGDFRKSFTFNDVNEDKFKGGQTMLDKRIDLQTAARYLMGRLYGFAEEDMQYVKTGFCFIITNKYNNALNVLEAVKKPSGIITYLRGLALEHAGAHSEAPASYDKAIRLDPNIYDAYKKRGIYRMELKLYEDAILDFSKMTEMAPQFLIGYKLRGVAKTLLGQHELAAADLTTYIAGDSSDIEALTTRGVCFEALSQWKKAGHDFYAAHELERLKNLGEHAIYNYQKAAEQDPSDVKVKFHLGVLTMQYINYDQGLRMVKSCRDNGYAPAIDFIKREKESRQPGTIRIRVR